LQAPNDFYRTVLDSLAEGIIITDAGSRIIYANRRMEEISGYSVDELTGRISYELLSPRQNWAKMRRRLRQRLSGTEEGYEHELVTKDGSIRWVAVKATPYRDATGQIAGTVGALSCIDRQKTLEKENEYLWSEIRAQGGFGDIVGSSAALAKV